MNLKQDITYAIRLLYKSPGFTALTVFVMAAGISLSVYIFSFFHVVLFKDLSFRDSETLVQIALKRNGARTFSELNLFDLDSIHKNVQEINEFSFYRNVSVNLSSQDGARRYSGVLVNHNFFSMTRTTPILGRNFVKEEMNENGEKVVVLGYEIWRNRYSLSNKVIGEKVKINGILHTIIGVMPKGYRFPMLADLWIPSRENVKNTLREEVNSYIGLAQISSNTSLKKLNRRISHVMRDLEEKFPNTNAGVSAYAESIPKSLMQDAGPTVYAMLVAAIFILILAALNVGNLLFSRAVERSKETAIRMALGAPRIKLVFQLVWESVIICLFGGFFALLILGWALEATEAITPSFFEWGRPFWMHFEVNSYSIKLLLIFVFVAIVLTGFIPTWKNLNENINLILRDGTRGSLGRKSGKINRLLVTGEIFLSIIILTVAGVMILTAIKESYADYGVETEGIITARILLPEKNYRSEESKTQFVVNLKTRLENQIGTGKVMISTAFPGDHVYLNPTIAIEGREYIQGSTNQYSRENYILSEPHMLKNLGVKLVAGRFFNESDNVAGKSTIIVTESFANTHFLGHSPLGKRVRIPEYDKNEIDWLTIIGVVEHTAHGPATDAKGKLGSIYRPYAQDPNPNLVVGLKTHQELKSASATLRSILKAIDPNLPAFKIETYSELVRRHSAPMQFLSSIFLLIGIVAISLAASGIYGVTSNSINQRTREIGVKRAFGANEKRVINEFLMEASRQFALGGIPGLLIGSFLGYAMLVRNGFSTADLLLITSVITALVFVSVLLATYIPIKRVIQNTPGHSLRYE